MERGMALKSINIGESGIKGREQVLHIREIIIGT